MSFTSDLNRIVKKTNKEIDDLIRAVKIEVFRRVIVNTRVDTGRAKGNWQMTEGSPATGDAENFDKTSKGSMNDSTLQEMNSTIEAISISFLTNNLPYIKKLEELDAMVALAAFQLEDILKEHARR